MLLDRAKSRCRKVKGMLSEYIDGALRHEDRVIVERHLETCAECSKELESLRLTMRMLKRVPVAVVPRSFAITGVEERKTSPAGPPNLGWLRPATALVTIAFVALLVVDFLPTSSEEGSIDSRELASQPSTPIMTAPSPGPEFDVAREGVAGMETTLASPPMPTDKVLTGEAVLRDSELPGAPGGGVQVGEAERGWPLRQIEIAVGAVTLALIVALLLTIRQLWKWRGTLG